MIHIYDSLRDDRGDLIPGRTKLFIKADDSEIEHPISGPICVPEGAGTMFIVDEWLIDQLHKVRLYYGRLAVKDGEELVPPVKSDLDLEEEELQRQLADIQRRRAEKANEPPAEVEELTEHDEIINDDLRQSTDNR